MENNEIEKKRENTEEISTESRHPTFGEEDMIHGVEAVAPRTFAEKLKNFWYHYKWPTVIGFVLLIAILGASMSTCVREDYDISVMVAGPLEVGGQTARDIAVSIEEYALDYDENGETNVAVNLLYIANYEDLRDSDNPVSGNLAAMSKQNRDTFQMEIMTGTYLICILSEELWREVDEADGLLPVTDYLPEESGSYRDAALYGDTEKTGIRLSDTPLYSLLGVRSLPGDMIVCIRRPSAVSAWYQSLLPWAKDENAIRHGWHEDTFRKLFLFGEDGE